MWKKSFTAHYQGVSKEAIWQAWANVTDWPSWDRSLESCEMTEPFASGASFLLKPKAGPKVRITLIDVQTNIAFSDQCKFLGAVMHDSHEVAETVDGVKVTNTISMTGPLSFLWWHLVGKKVSKSIAEQTNNLIHYIREKHD